MEEELLRSLAELPGGAELIELAAEHEEVELVGGAVRDLLLGRVPRELDAVVPGDAPKLAQALADGPDAQVTIHDRFGTALVQWDGARIDLAARRAESYPSPGALPDVRPGEREEDLRRRDFTVNAISLSLAGPAVGELHAVPNALQDLEHGRLRVLHERSFIDDPTRLLRLGRYAARLNFTVDELTLQLAHDAIATGALHTVSGARLGAELRLALAEQDPLQTLTSLQGLGVLTGLHPRLRVDERLVREALALLPADGDPQVLLLACLLLPLVLRAGDDPRGEILSLLDRLEFLRGERDRVVQAAVGVPVLAGELQSAGSDSQLYLAASRSPIEGVAIAGALESEQRDGESNAGKLAARRWLQETRHVALKITGEDLLEAGVPAGPEIGARLRLALLMRLDGKLDDGREAELHAALEGQP